jgi:hypothetical protein
MNVHAKIAELQLQVGREAEEAKYHVSLFELAAMQGDAAEAGRQRELVLAAQGQMMDTIYAAITLQRKSGVKMR